MIPKKLHFIWVGDESRRPDNCIQTWIDAHPGWQVKVWGNDALATEPWVNGAHMAAMSEKELNGVADMMRWEILYREGGIVLDADSICLRPLDPELLDCEAFACWESEIARPGLIAAGYFGTVAENPFVGQIIQDIHAEESVTDELAWVTVGPQRLTDAYRAYAYHGLRIYPSHYFIPEHFSGVTYEGPGPVYANQLWGSTRGTYDSIHTLDPTRYSRPGWNEGRLFRPPDAGSIAGRHASYFVQRVPVSQELRGVGRVDLFRTLVQGKRVLHVGCADWPITDPRTSLHLALEPFCERLDGYDIHAEALEGLRPHLNGGGELFDDPTQLTGSWDVVLVPEVLEHVPNVAEFLDQLARLDASTIVMSVPDAYSCFARHFAYDGAAQVLTEVVHPDHNCWYTPYTFTNTIRKYTDWTIDKLWFVGGISILAILSVPRVRPSESSGHERSRDPAPTPR